MIERVLARGRERAESLMQSRVRVRREGPKTRETATGLETPTWTIVYEGPARLRASNAQPQDVDAAGQQLTERDQELSLPIGYHPDIETGASIHVHVNDVGELLANPHDPAAVGLQFRVRDGHVQTHSTARRLPVEVISHA